MKKLPKSLIPFAAVSMLLGAQVACAAQADAPGAACSALVGKRLSMGVIKKAKAVAAGQSVSLAGAKLEPAAPFAFCQVEATLQSEPGSQIQSAFWLPAPPAWNGKFVGLGNGGYGGIIPEAHLFATMRLGYAVAATDMGHPASFPRMLSPMSGKWAYKKPVQLADWAHRANHLTAQAGKELVVLHLGQKPKRAYFHGCSDGGREALMQAGRYPEDYDGIIAGAPAAAFTDLMSQAQWNARHAAKTQLTETKLGLLYDAVLARCDALDGAQDGLMENPSACKFDPAVLQCKANEDQDRCLSKVEVDAVRAIYEGPRTSDGKQVFPGFSLGSEYLEGWNLWITGPQLPLIGTVKRMTGGSLISTDFFRWMVHADPDWTREQFDFDRDLRLARERLAATINSNELDLSAFFARDNKLMLYHGWSDAALPAVNTIRYYDQLRARHGEAAAQGARLFMAPGMGHCMSGPGPNTFDALAAMDQWVEAGTAPEQIIATKFANEEAGALGQPAKALRTRPLCAWPKLARWNGKGSLDAAENFSCLMPEAVVAH